MVLFLNIKGEVRNHSLMKMIKIEGMEDERLVYSIITPDTPKRIKEKLLDALEEFGEQRAI